MSEVVRFFYSEKPDRPDGYLGIDPDLIDLCENKIPTIICCPHESDIGNLFNCAQRNNWRVCVFSVNRESDIEKLMKYWRRHGKLKRRFYNSIGAKRLFFTFSGVDLYDWVQGIPVERRLLQKTLDFAEWSESREKA